MPRRREFQPEQCACGLTVWTRVKRWHVAIVDADDGHLLYAQAWAVLGDGYFADGRGALLHRVVAGAPKGVLIDHKSRNKSDCRKSNLRPSDYRQNGYNSRGKKKPGASRFKGVSRSTAPGSWMARIRTPTGRLYLGTFADEVDAALAYDAAAREHHGEFALTNF